MIKTVTKLDMLKKTQECLDKDIELKDRIKIDIDEENKTDADLNLLIITDLPDKWEIRDKITSLIYNCLEEIDPYITVHFNWNFIR